VNRDNDERKDCEKDVEIGVKRENIIKECEVRTGRLGWNDRRM
jgi:hypothetical protein